MLLAMLALLAFQQAPTVQQTPAAPSARGGARDPAYAADGRLALSVHGDLWIVRTDGRWMRLTSDSAWDREPAWTRDGGALVFSSNRGGHFNLWRMPIGPEGATAPPSALTSGADDDAEPTTALDGRIVFVRGRGSSARLWVRDSTGAITRFTSGRTAERWPAASPDGRRIAYVAVSENGRRLIVRGLDGHADTVVNGPSISHPAWAPSADRLTYTTTGPRGGVFVVPADGGYSNLVSTRHAASSWSADGMRLALVDLPDEDVAYNGDPDRVGDRDVANTLAGAGQLWYVDAPQPPDHSAAEQPGAPVASRAEHNARAFDEVWSRTTALYYSAPDAADRRARWEALRDRYRPRALAARNDDELKTIIHEMLREHPPYRSAASGRAAVSSAHPVATAAGLEMLRRGGNVVDAAVAVSFALGVVEPDASGPGGYGQMLVYRNGMPAPRLIEFMSRVPEDAGLGNAELLRDGRLPDDGPVLANVPGTVAAMYLAWKRYGSGKLAWADLLAPAIHAARDGYPVSEGLATTLATEREHFLKYDGSRKLFFRDGRPVVAGDTIHNPDLAWTLEQIAAGGADAFYRGEVARRLVADLRGHGNAMKLTDMARYYAAEREPVSDSYRGYTFFSSAPPVSGGATLAATLNMLEQYRDPRPYTDDAATLHAMLTAWELVPSTRNRIADPGLWPVDITPFVDKDTAAARWRCYDPEKAIPPAAIAGDSLRCAARVSLNARSSSFVLRSSPANYEERSTNDALPGATGCETSQLHYCHSAGTTAFVVADADGNVVAATQTLGTWGGNFYVTPGLGFLYNDKLASYGTDPEQYGARLPFARHGSTITPTIIFEGTGARRHAAFALGAAGNAWINAAVYETFVGLVDEHLDPQAALELPRFLIGGRGRAGAKVSVEMEDGFSTDVMRRLVELGYEPHVVSLMGELREGYGAALAIAPGKVTAGADPRRAGAAGALP